MVFLCIAAPPPRLMAFTSFRPLADPPHKGEGRRASSSPRPASGLAIVEEVGKRGTGPSLPDILRGAARPHPAGSLFDRRPRDDSRLPLSPGHVNPPPEAPVPPHQTTVMIGVPDGSDWQRLWIKSGRRGEKQEKKIRKARRPAASGGLQARSCPRFRPVKHLHPSPFSRTCKQVRQGEAEPSGEPGEGAGACRVG
jgi:hypothetical protein